jgi:hypothetical protein
MVLMTYTTRGAGVAFRVGIPDVTVDLAAHPSPDRCTQTQLIVTGAFRAIYFSASPLMTRAKECTCLRC